MGVIRNSEQNKLIEKIDSHPGGPITLTQEECWTLATIVDQTNTLSERRLRLIENALELLEPQTKRVTSSMPTIRQAVQILKGR